jgi:ribosomal protein S18 acetylase RimI-like enzyme
VAVHPMEIRAATADDLAGLSDLYKHLNPDDEPPEMAVARESFRQLHLYPGSAVLVGTVAGELVSSCTLIVIPNLTRTGRPYGLIENVVTHSAWRKRGHGTALLRHAASRGFDHGCYKVMLMTGSKEPATLAFYANAGFAQTKTGFQMRAP